jgi:hypothetical protein
MPKVTMHIMLEIEDEEPVSIVGTADEELIIDFAIVMIEDAEILAEEVEAKDEALGKLQRQEAVRIRKALELVFPELRHLGKVRSNLEVI